MQLVPAGAERWGAGRLLAELRDCDREPLVGRVAQDLLCDPEVAGVEMGIPVGGADAVLELHADLLAWMPDAGERLLDVAAVDEDHAVVRVRIPAAAAAAAGADAIP